MADIHIRKTAQTGRITLSRPKALNALSHEMGLAIEEALDRWAKDPDIAMLVIDAEGDRAFCAGGDIQEMYDTAKVGNFEYGRQFWRDEYRMNAKLFEFPHPVVTFLQGFTMGGGVGVGCHGSHRIVGASSQIAMPEVGIGLIPDVGGSYILAHAPGRLGEYLGMTGARMGPADAILAGFADYFIPEADWSDLITALETTADPSLVDAAAQTAPPGALAAKQTEIDAIFAGEDLQSIFNALNAQQTEFAEKTLTLLRRNAPLSMGAALEVIRRNRAYSSLRPALEQEYRFTYRSAEEGEFIEGIRAAIIDKDRSPKWRHTLAQPPSHEITQMLLPLGAQKLTFEKKG